MIKVINTGGTFNKIYDPIKGSLVVPKESSAVKRAIKPLTAGVDIEIEGMIYKDSLDFEDSDRERILSAINKARQKYMVVVHGTDTMCKSAEYIASKVENSAKVIIFTGAMVPLSIEPIEATANIVLAISTIRFLNNGVYIAMNGYVLPHKEIYKDRALGAFKKV